jgi:hypothetical protein
MEDKTIHTDNTRRSRAPRRHEMISEEWFALMDREVEEIVRLVDENSKLLGLPPVDQDYPASSKRR